MQQKNSIKNIVLDQKNQEYNNKKPPSFKNIYAKIRKNIKTSFPSTKQKNTINLINTKKLIENQYKKNNNSNINLMFNKKEESRNYNSNNVEKIYDNDQDEEINDNDEIFYFNKTQKNVKLLYSNYSKKILNTRKDSKNNIKNNNGNHVNYKKKKFNYYTNKYKTLKEERKVPNNKLLLQNKNIINNKEIKQLNIGNNNEKNDLKNKKNEKNSLEKNSKVLINKKIFSKDEFIKTKNLNDKVQSARLGNYDIHKLNLNLNLNQDINSELKRDSNKKTYRMNSQKNIKLNENEFDTETINQIKKIKKNTLIRQLTKQSSKNHSMHLNSNNKAILLNDTIKNNLNKTKKKYSIASIYNYPNIRNNLKQNIPFDKDTIFDSADKNIKDNSENNFYNNYYNMDHTCINFKNMNNTLNNNINGALNNTNEKNTPKSNNNNNSFSKPYSQEKISSFFYSKPVARLKKRIFNSPSDKDIENSINNIDINNYDFDNNYNDDDSLEMKDKKNNVEYNFKKLLISIKILNQIINTQNEIIREHIKNEIELKKEIEKKDKEIKDYKDISIKLMFYLQNEKEINILSDLTKKRKRIQNQLLKENNILRSLVSSIFNYNKKINNRNDSINSDTYNKSFNMSNNNEGDSSINIYYIKKENTNNNFYQKIDYNNGIKEKKINSFYDIGCNNNIINKRREKSYENRKNRRNKDSIINAIKNNINNNDIYEENEKKKNKKICYIVKDRNIAFTYEKNIL